MWTPIAALSVYCNRSGFAMFWSKPYLISDKVPSLFTKLLLTAQQGKYQVIFLRKNKPQSVFSKFSKTHEITWNKWPAIQFHPGHLQPKIIKTSICKQRSRVIVLLLTKLSYYIYICIDTNMFFPIQSDT